MLYKEQSIDFQYLNNKLTNEDLYYFQLLKEAVSGKLLKSHSLSGTIENWKGEDIVLFQEDLFLRVKAKVSEKWFYTYFKNTPEKLPRIDMLNILSNYAGFSNWNHFKAAHDKTNLKSNPRKKFVFWLLLIIPLIVFVFSMIGRPNEFHFCFIDEVKGDFITNIPLDIKVLQEDQTPIYLKTDSTGCVLIKTKDDMVKFVIQSPYHKTDTIVRHLNSSANQTIELATDDYALMLNYYLSGNVKDWKRHRTHLSDLISENAVIYQMFNDQLGIELYTKEEFIRFLTIPTTSLKHVQILDKNYENGKIVKLKFVVK